VERRSGRPDTAACRRRLARPAQSGRRAAARIPDYLRAGRACRPDREWILWLENDWESVAPIPDAKFLDRAARGDIETIRLFGAYKMRGTSARAPAGPHVIGTKRLIQWRESYSAGWEEGRAHWGCGGTLIRTDVLARHALLDGLKEIMHATADLLTLRPKTNIMWHIGAETTAGFVP
jgi:hypothetical protein